MNFPPALGEAGAQVISARVAGFPIMVSNYAGGVLTWTTGGLMRSEFTGDQETYRHRDINTEYRPVNSFCVLQTDKNTSRSEEHTSELQSLMRISYAVFCLKKKNKRL